MKDGLNVSTFSCGQLFVFMVFLIPWCIVFLLKALINLKQHNDWSNIQLYQVLTKNYSTSPGVPIGTWRDQEGISEPIKEFSAQPSIFRWTRSQNPLKNSHFLSNLWGARYLCCCAMPSWGHSTDGWRLYQIFFVSICRKLIN